MRPMRRRRASRRREAARFMGGIDTIVVSAGAGGRTPVFDTEPEEFQRIMDHTLRPAFLCCAMRPASAGSGQRRRSSSFRRCSGWSASASASPIAGPKPASSAWSRRWRSTLPTRGVRVNAICPGFVETACPRGGAPEADPEAALRAKRLMHPIPARRKLEEMGELRRLPRFRQVRLHDGAGDERRRRLSIR